ncbi:hypothetical protein N2152v2_009662 [Parachlorella kessleri]
MEGCQLKQLPEELTALEGLASLGIMHNEAPLDEATWQLLPRLKALTALKIKGCSLSALPPQLSALTQLAYLSVGGNDGLGNKADISNSSHKAWAPLQHLTALTGLKLDGCDLRRLPRALASLCQLRKLSLYGNSQMGRGPDSWEPLAALTALKNLGLSQCGIHRLPGQLSVKGKDYSVATWGLAPWGFPKEDNQWLTCLRRG